MKCNKKVSVTENEVKRTVSGVRYDEYAIPEITDEEIERLSKQMRACYRFDKVLRYIVPVDARCVAFTWDAEQAEVAEDLEALEDILTLHRYAYYGFFKPSIAEVMAQIPKELLDQVVAFEIVEHPEDVSDLKATTEAVHAGFHVATTRLYKKKCTGTS
jgi:uncharacterized protein (DUF2236 family)